MTAEPMKRGRWPMAMRILMEHKARDGVRLYTLVCDAAECQRCDWRGPLRAGADAAGRDGIAHIAEAHGGKR